MRGSVLAAPARSGQECFGGNPINCLPAPFRRIIPIRPNGVHNGMGNAWGEGFREGLGPVPKAARAGRNRGNTEPTPLKPSRERSLVVITANPSSEHPLTLVVGGPGEEDWRLNGPGRVEVVSSSKLPRTLSQRDAKPPRATERKRRLSTVEHQPEKGDGLRFCIEVGLNARTVPAYVR